MTFFGEKYSSSFARFYTEDATSGGLTQFNLTDAEVEAISQLDKDISYQIISKSLKILSARIDLDKPTGQIVVYPDQYDDMKAILAAMRIYPEKA